VVNRPVVERHVRDHLPYMATENLLMAAVRAGGDRQAVHEVVRKHSHAVTEKVKAGTGTAAELFDRLKADPAFAKVDFAAVLEPRGFVGRAPEQVAEFVADHVEPVRKRYANVLEMKAELEI
jgi:adenylosuccinate lyase